MSEDSSSDSSSDPFDSSDSSSSETCENEIIVLYSSTLSIFIFIGVLGAILSKKKIFVSNEINIKNDDIIINKFIDINIDTKNINNNDNTATNQSIENQNLSKTENSNEKFAEESIDKNNLFFRNILFSNFLKLYPFCFIRSNINPIIMRLFMLMFNFLNYFNIKALIFEDKEEKKNDYNFSYPLRSEFPKIILGLLIQMILCLILKCIYVVNKNDRDNLENNLKHCVTEKEREKKCNEFNQTYFLKRVIAIILIIIIETFFIIYFSCNEYENKCNWAYSGFWTCFFAWVIFAPIFIILISYIEWKKNKNNEKLIYYLKQLFFF